MLVMILRGVWVSRVKKLARQQLRRSLINQRGISQRTGDLGSSTDLALLTLKYPCTVV